MSRCDFLALPYSPWSEKARWSLDHHRVDYREIEHVPMLGAPLLRLRAKRPFGRVSVPLLVDGREVLHDSLSIARYAERVGMGEPLFPEGMDDAVATWNGRSETILDAGRALLLERIVSDRDALVESVPVAFPSSVRSRLVPVARMGARHIARKYAANGPSGAHERARVRRELRALREILAGPQSYVLGRFTYADVVMAVSLQVVRPVADRWLSLGEATRRVWEDPELVQELDDLLAWRDWVYDRHR